MNRSNISAALTMQGVRFPRIIGISIYWDNDPSGNLECCLNLILALEMSNPKEFLSITALGVADVSIADPSYSKPVVLQVLDERGRQWEAISYRVLDEESNAIDFLARDLLVEAQARA